MSVLIVDDCADTTDSLGVLARVWGFEVHIANDAKTALRLASEYSPDVVLLDVAMPGMTGWQLARRLREVGGLEKALLVALSGYASEADCRHSLEAGCDRHLVKPADPEQLRLLLVEREKENRGHGTEGTDPAAAGPEHGC
jgi:two-component system CheB/CheR fusion protein